MPKALFDLHTHTVASGHAFSTLKENLEQAAASGLYAMGTSDHGPSIPGGAPASLFSTYRVLHDRILGIRLYKGIEANIMDYTGTLDVPKRLYSRLDYIIASMHPVCLPCGTIEQNTAAALGVMKNPAVAILGHPDDGRYPLDYEQVVAAARLYSVALEVNNSSFNPLNSRQNGPENIRTYLELCRHYAVPIVLGSDAHVFYDIGNFNEAQPLLEEIGFPDDLVLTCSLSSLPKIMHRQI